MDTRQDIGSLERKARRVRATCVQMSFDANETHLSSALSCADILVALYSRFLTVFPGHPARRDRDRFFLSKGHACSALYAVLAESGLVPRESLGTYAQADSAYPNHPCKHALPLLEASTGSLGHGLGLATGALYGLRMDGVGARAVVLMSDGECNEGSTWEAATFAVANKLDRLLAVVDYNGTQAVGRSDELMGHASLEEKFRSFGWAAVTVDGNDLRALCEVLDRVPFECGKPSVIVAKTRCGAGISFMEGDLAWYYRRPNADEVARALDELGEVPIHVNHA